MPLYATAAVMDQGDLPGGAREQHQPPQCNPIAERVFRRNRGGLHARARKAERTLEDDETLVKLEKRVNGEYQEIAGTDTRCNKRRNTATSAQAPGSAGILMFADVAVVAIGLLATFNWMTISPMTGIYMAIVSVVSGALLSGFGKIIALLNGIHGLMAEQIQEAKSRA